MKYTKPKTSTNATSRRLHMTSPSFIFFLPAGLQPPLPVFCKLSQSNASAERIRFCCEMPTVSRTNSFSREPQEVRFSALDQFLDSRVAVQLYLLHAALRPGIDSTTVRATAQLFVAHSVDLNLTREGGSRMVFPQR